MTATLPCGERLVRCLTGEPVDRVPFGVNLGWWPWGETMDRWKRESGQPDLDIGRWFGYDASFASPSDVTEYAPMKSAILGVAILFAAGWGVARAGGDEAGMDASIAGPPGANPPATGLCALAQTAAAAAVGDKMVFRLSLRNAGPLAVDPNATTGSTAWLLIGAPGGNACFTGQIRLESEGPGGSPEPAPVGTLRFQPVDAGAATAYLFDHGLKLTNGYVANAAGERPAPAGKLKDVLPPGKLRAKWMINVPRGAGAPPLSLWTPALEVVVGPPRLAALSTDARRAYVADLLKRFDRDAWSAREAHEEAVALGPGILPDLIAAAKERGRPEHSRLWLVTAVADIPDAKAVAALIDVLNDPKGRLRCVVAYHGPKQKSDALDRAIIEKAKSGGDAAFISYALLGLMVSQGRVPEDLLKAGIESDDPRVRATAARALAGMASDWNKTRLQVLLRDSDPRVRAAAQKVLEAMTFD